LELLLPPAGIRVRFRATLPEMSRKGVAQEVPFSGYRDPENIKTLKSGSSEPLFRGAWQAAEKVSRRSMTCAAAGNLPVRHYHGAGHPPALFWK
jgi:hypothetical protein